MVKQIHNRDIRIFLSRWVHERSFPFRRYSMAVPSAPDSASRRNHSLNVPPTPTKENRQGTLMLINVWRWPKSRVGPRRGGSVKRLHLFLLMAFVMVSTASAQETASVSVNTKTSTDALPTLTTMATPGDPASAPDASPPAAPAPEPKFVFGGRDDYRIE